MKDLFKIKALEYRLNFSNQDTDTENYIQRLKARKQSLEQEVILENHLPLLADR